MREEKLIAYLKGAFKGRNKTIKSAELERAMEMSGTDLRKLVNKLRRKSIPICSGADGYFYAKTAGDILRTIRQLKVMIKGLQAAVDGGGAGQVCGALRGPRRDPAKRSRWGEEEQRSE